MARTSISISDDLYTLSLEIGKIERRDFSNLCSIALEEFLKSRGYHPSSISKKAELLAAVAEIGEDRAIEILTRAARRKCKVEKAAA